MIFNAFIFVILRLNSFCRCFNLWASLTTKNRFFQSNPNLGKKSFINHDRFLHQQLTAIKVLILKFKTFENLIRIWKYSKNLFVWWLKSLKLIIETWIRHIEQTFYQKSLEVNQSENLIKHQKHQNNLFWMLLSILLKMFFITNQKFYRFSCSNSLILRCLQSSFLLHKLIVTNILVKFVILLTI